jgi:ABC-2 type transport system permease protein
MRLLRPIHPFIAYAVTHAAALPFRSLIALPVCVVLLISSGASALTTEPLQLVLLLPSLILAWLIQFGVLFSLGCAAFWITQPWGLVNFYFGVWSLLSGYLLPLDLLPDLITRIAKWLPFYAMLGAPVELILGHLSASQVAEIFARQGIWAVAVVVISLTLWRAGVRRFEAVGG